MQLASNQSQLMLDKPESSFQVFNQCAPVVREHATASQGSRALIHSNNTSHRDSSLYILVSKPHSAAYTASTSYHLANGNLQVLRRDRGQAAHEIDERAGVIEHLSAPLQVFGSLLLEED
jgi:hypothetical protein